MFFNKRQIIGLDLGASRAKAVLLEQRKGDNSVVVRDYAIDRLDEPNLPLETQLRRLLRQLRSRCRDCAVSVWPSGSKLRVINGNVEPETVREMRQGIADQKKLFHEELKGYLCEYGEISSLTRRKADPSFAVCALPEIELTRIEKALHTLGYRIQVVQMAPLAVLNAFAASQGEQELKRPFVLVDFGRACMTILGGSAAGLRMLRRIEFPWGEIPEPLVAVTGNNHSGENTENAAEEEALAAIFGEVTDLLAFELQPLLDFFRNHDDSSHLDQVYISGGLSNHRTVVRRLVERLGLQCVQWNPFRHIAAHRRALDNFDLFSELAHLPAAAGAAFQRLA